MCQECLRLSAFNKGAEALQKVGGQLLCFLCTRNYKRKLRTREQQESGSSSKKRERSESSVPSSSNGSAPSKKHHSHIPSSSSSSLSEPNWKTLYDEKEAQAQKQSTEYLEKYILRFICTNSLISNF